MATVNSRETPAWHALPTDGVVARLDTTRWGLTQQEAAERLANWGPNAIPRTAPTPAWRILVQQCRGVVVGLLVAALIAAWFMAEHADAAAIAAVLVLNIVLGFVMELRSRYAVESLAALETRVATVMRDGRRAEIDAREVVPGDLVLLEAGQSIPADARLISGDIRVNESTLTGESLPVSKRAGPEVAAEASLPERVTMAYAGTLVAAGAAHAVVVATGADTELGAIGRLVASTAAQPTPLEEQLDRLGRQLVWVALAIAALAALLSWRQGISLALVVQSSIALAVAAVPEGLPAVATITLALAVHRMARQHALVRRLPAAESLGSVTVLCTDKTGTLTGGTMAVTTIRTLDAAFDVSGTSFEPVGEFWLNGQSIVPDEYPQLEQALQVGVLASRGDALLTDRGWVAQGDPTESALIVAARKAGLERLEVIGTAHEVGEVPFSSERQWMAVFYRQAATDQAIAFVKGNPSRVLERCSRTMSGAAVASLDDTTRAAIQHDNRQMAAAGLRVLALAFGGVAESSESALNSLTFVALVGIADPPAPGVHQTIRTFRNAGITTVMITGDQRGTAEAVARQLGLEGTTVEGRTLDAASDAQVPGLVRDAAVFSRISPAAKLRLVDAYQRAGHVVAMIGDGVNDAAALKKADIGVTMGRRGTDVARESAAVVLEDDRFETIGAAIAEGRLVFENIRRFVFYLFSCNLAEVFVLLGTSAAGFPLPLAPIQVLWLNLVTDTVPAISLAFEPGSGDLMARPPRPPRTAIVSWPFMRSITGYAAVMAAAVFAVMIWNAWAGTAPRVAITMNFMVLGLTQIFHLGNARDARPVLSLPRIIANPYALGAVAISVASLALVTRLPIVSDLLRVVRLSSGEWLVVLAASLLPAVVGQTVKIARWGISVPRAARHGLATIVVLLVAATVAAQPVQRIAGGVREAVAGKGDTLRSIGSRHGVDPAIIARDNALAPTARLASGQRLVIDARHIVPQQLSPGTIVVNVPQRMLFLAVDASVQAWPVAVGRRSWPTPLGPFAVVTREEHPTWDVPASIMEEARRAGHILPPSVPPGPDNPLGDYWLGLSIGGVGIHGTNAPSSIYQAVTHGCIRVHPDDIAQLFPQVQAGARGLLIYEPVLVARVGDSVLLEVHPDVYRRGASDIQAHVRTRVAEWQGVDDVDWTRVAATIAERAGVPRVVSFPSAGRDRRE